MIIRTAIAIALSVPSLAAAQRALPSDLELVAACPPETLAGTLELLRVELPVTLSPVERSSGDAIELECAELDVTVRIVDRNADRSAERIVALAEVAEPSRARVLALAIAELVRTSWPSLERIEVDASPTEVAPAEVAPTELPPPRLPATTAEPPTVGPSPAPFSFGAQLALDGSFDVLHLGGGGLPEWLVSRDLLMPQLGAIFHVRLPDAMSLRFLLAFAYVPTPGRTYSDGPFTTAQAPPEHELTLELRTGLGFRLVPELEARVFLSARAANHLVPGNSAVPDVVTSPEPIVLGPRDSWMHTFTLLAGTEWTIYPEDTRRLEVTGALGIGMGITNGITGNYLIRAGFTIAGSLAVGVLVD